MKSKVQLFVLLFLVFCLACVIAGCSTHHKAKGDDDTAADDDAVQDDDATDDDSADDDTGPYYDPTWAVSTDVLPEIRGLKTIRGIIHAHSWYSHDACDNNPVGNTECLAQMREAFCTTKQDYIMLSDHGTMFADHEYPDVLLYEADQGDQLLFDEENLPIANRITCPDNSVVTLMAGTENDIMPIHIHHHPAGTIDERHALYSRTDPAVVPLLHDLGATLIVQHDEEWTTDNLKALAPDGIEIFNLHAAIAPNLRPNLGLPSLDFVANVLSFMTDPKKPAPNLMIMTFWPETTAWSDRWDALLGVQKTYATAGTDCHRNALPFPLSDGERADGYRRMMQFFSNWIKVTGEEPADLEDGIDNGRLMAVFEFLGFPMGFDFYATDGKTDYEMGEDITMHSGLTI